MARFLTDYVKQMLHTGVPLICVGKKEKGGFISCHGKLTVYLKKFTHDYFKSNADSLSANIKEDDSSSDLLPPSHPQIYFQDLRKN